MRKKILFRNIWAMMLLAVMGFALTSCSDDDEPAVITYEMGFSKMSSTTTDALEEMSSIENAFRTALGVKGSSFVKNGTNDACDKEVKAACEEAFSTLKSNVYKNSYVFQVTNSKTGTVVFGAVFQANDANFVF